MPISQRFVTIILLLFTLCKVADAQNDTIVSTRGEILIGKIEILEKGILTFETHYSDKDFSIEWDQIQKIKTSRAFLIILTDGRRINGSVNSLPGDSSIVMITSGFSFFMIDDILDIVYLKPVESTFFGRLDASIEVGYTFTKEKNNHQFNTRSSIGYFSDTWGVNGFFDMNQSVQDSVVPTRRTDASVGFIKYFENSWYLGLSNNFFQSNEQKIKLRSITNVSYGHFIINTYKSYWGLGAGLAYNYESFTSDEPDEKSLEALINSELNLFAFEDLSLLSSIKIYPSITVWGRIRSDFKFDIKYDLPLDFFIKIGLTHNFDNQPVEGAEKNDFIIQTTFGWEL
jgi:hypothetical protein